MSNMSLCKEQMSLIKNICGKMYNNWEYIDVNIDKYNIKELEEYVKKINETKSYALLCYELRNKYTDACHSMLDSDHFQMIYSSKKLHRDCERIINKVNDRIEELKIKYMNYNKNPNYKILSEEKQKECKEHYKSYKDMCKRMYNEVDCESINIDNYNIDELKEYIKKINLTKSYAMLCYTLRDVYVSKCAGVLDAGHYHQIHAAKVISKKCQGIVDKVNNRIEELKVSNKESWPELNILSKKVNKEL